jgi:hypothetical protein
MHASRVLAGRSWSRLSEPDRTLGVDVPSQYDSVKWRRRARVAYRQLDAKTAFLQEMAMGKGDKQHGNREAKKPKADKKVAPASASFIKPQADARKPGAKPAK